MVMFRDFTLRIREKVLVQQTTVTIRKGERIVLLGANGSGKSIFLKTLAGIPTAAKFSGSATVFGKKLCVGAHSGQVAWVPQIPPHDVPLRAEEYVMLGRTEHLSLWGTPDAADRACVRDAMEQTDTERLRGQLLSEMSGGEAQRLALAMALATGAELLLLDEPTAHLDLLQKERMKRLLRTFDKTLLIVTHDVEWARTFPRVWFLHHATLLDGTPETLLTAEKMESLLSS